MTVTLKNCTLNPIHFRQEDGQITVLPSEYWVTVPGEQRFLDSNKVLPFAFWQNTPTDSEPELPPVKPGEVLIVTEEVLKFAQWKSTGRANRLWREYRMFAPGLSKAQGAEKEGGKTIVRHFVRSA